MPKRCPVNPHWWQVPKVVAGWVAGLVAVGAVATFLATQIGLPKRVAAGEQHDVVQDSRWDKYLQQQELDRAEELGYKNALNELLTQQVNGAASNRRNFSDDSVDQIRRERVWSEEGADGGCWTCTAKFYDDCWEFRKWVPCE